MINVLYDDDTFSRQAVGGISRYFMEIISRLEREPDVSVSLSLVATANEYARRLPTFNGIFLPGRRHLKGRRRLLRLVNRPALIRKLRRQEFDVFHFTYYDTSVLPYLADKPFVITIHDLIPELQCQTSIASQKQSLVERAARIIAVSRHTQQDLISRYGVSPDRIDVIYHGPSASLIYRGGANPARIPQPFLLFVGDRSSYKNFRGAAGPMARTLRAVPGLYLLCVGGGPLTEEEMASFEDQGCRERVLQMGLADDGLAWAYAHATALVYPSLYEGFGMPILEAFANDCPAVLSNRSCLPEIAGDGALYFDPDKPCELEAALLRTIADPELRRSVVRAARQRLREFSWRRSAEAHLRCYLKAAGR